MKNTFLIWCMGSSHYFCLIKNDRKTEDNEQKNDEKEIIPLFEKIKTQGPQIKLQINGHVTVNQNFISEENILKSIGNFLKGNIVVKSGMGTGKTKLIEDVCEFYFKNKNILYIVNRITLGVNISQWLGFKNYQDF